MPKSDGPYLILTQRSLVSYDSASLNNRTKSVGIPLFQHWKQSKKWKLLRLFLSTRKENQRQMLLFPHRNVVSETEEESVLSRVEALIHLLISPSVKPITPLLIKESFCWLPDIWHCMILYNVNIRLDTEV